MKKRIFTKLIGSFLLFFVIVLLTFLACLLLESFYIGGGTPENIIPSNVVDQDGNVKNLDSVKKLGGWVEELDLDYRVVKVYGEKKTDIRQYTPDDIYALTAVTETQDPKRVHGFQLNLHNDQEGYIGFIDKVEKINRYFLCIYSRNVMQVNTTVVFNGDDAAADHSLDPFFVLFFAALIMEILLLSLYLRRKIKNPLDQLVAGMERIQSGESGVILDIKTEAEFEQIVDTFNMMTQELERQKQENVRLVTQKNQMLLELSHDIKTPIATIKSYANALEAGLVPEEKQQAYHHTIDVKADRVQMLMEDMFLMLKMDNSDYHLHTQQINLCEFLRKICAEYYDEITEAGFDFVIDIPDEAILAEIDEKLFARVIGNLLSNARKYNRTGEQIGIACEQNDQKISIRITDDGEAIDDVLSGQMFSAFVRGDKTRKSDGGTGLGLAISKIIVEKHGGRIEYFWEAKNVFVITM